jgi:hypothetical protein
MPDWKYFSFCSISGMLNRIRIFCRIWFFFLQNKNITFVSVKVDFRPDSSTGTVIRVQCCGPGMFIPDPNFSIPDLGSKRFRIPDSDSHQRISVFLTLKTVSNCLNDLGKMIWDVYSGYGFLFRSGSRIQESKSTGSRIHNTFRNDLCFTRKN